MLERHPDFAAGLSPSIDMAERPGIEGIVRSERREDYRTGSARRASEESRGHDWQEDKTGGSYLSRLAARYGPALPGRLELFKRQELEPAIRQALDSTGSEEPVSTAGAVD